MKDVKINDLSQVETLIQSTQAFTEQLVIMNKLLEQINTNTTAQTTFFTSKDGFVKLMSEISKQQYEDIKKEMSHQFNVLYLKIAGALAGIIGVATAILKLVSG